jgi:hypothetical protein
VDVQVIISIRRVDGLPWSEGVDTFLARLGREASIVHGELDAWDGASFVLWSTGNPGARLDRLPPELVRRALPRTIVVMAGYSEVFDLVKHHDILGAIDAASYYAAAGLGPDLRRGTALLGTRPWGLLAPTAVASAQGLRHHEHFSDRRYCSIESDEPLPETLCTYLRMVSGSVAHSRLR